MPLSTIATLGAGTVLAFEDPGTPDTYLDLVHALNLGETGERGEFVQTTPISATVHEYISGMKEPPDKEFTLNDVPADADQETFLAEAQAGNTSKMKITFTSGKIADFTVALNGFVRNEPAADGQITVTVYAKQIGDVTWTDSV